MPLAKMDSAEIDLSNTLLSTNAISNDYENDLQLAAEVGRCLLEQNQDLKSYIHVLQKQIEEKDYDMNLLHTKLLSTREQFEAKCKQAELLDATNFDLEQELSIQRRENEKNRQQIKDLLDLCEITRQQYQDMQHEYETFRAKQLSSNFLSKSLQPRSPSPSPPIFSTPISTKRQRANSFSNQSTIESLPIISSNLFSCSSTEIFKTHLTELKSRLNSLNNECSSLNDQVHRSEQEKTCLINRLTQLERQYRDEQDALQTELDYYRKLADKHSFEQSNTYSSSSEHNLSLYDEVLLENKQIKPFFEPTDYKQLFARVYEKLKVK